MKVVALVSGGKDSCYNMMQCITEGHEIVALANLRPRDTDEMDSYMYQTVGHQAIDYYAEAMDLPLYRRTIQGRSKNVESDYLIDSEDEVEDLVALLQNVMKYHSIEGVAVGAILSNYQRVRVENVCSRLGLTSLAYLWRRGQDELLKEMIESKVEAVIIKVAAMGLLPNDLGKTLEEIYPKMEKLSREFGLNVCGEGGEYESFTLDCPLFNKRLIVDEKEVVMHSDTLYAPVAYLNFTKLHLEDKGVAEIPRIERIRELPMKSSQQCLLELGLEEKSSPVEYSKSSDHLVSVEISQTETDSSLWVGGLSSLDVENLENATSEVMEKIGTILRSKGFDFSNVCVVHLYVRDMENFARINDVYKQYFSSNPPVRVCVEAQLCVNQPLIMDCYARKNNDVTMGNDDDIRTMHVQGISHWAPANIGPYSQCKQIGRSVYVAGQIALVPGSMTIVGGGIVTESRLALRHVTRVLEAMSDQKISIRDVTCMICYVTNVVFIGDAKKELVKDNAECPSVFLVIPKLPRNAAVEWEAVANLDFDAMKITKSQNVLDHISVETSICSKDDVPFTSLIKVSLENDASLSIENLYANLNVIIQQNLSNQSFNGGLLRTFYRSRNFRNDELCGRIREGIDTIKINVAVSLIPVIALETENMVSCFVLTR